MTAFQGHLSTEETTYVEAQLMNNILDFRGPAKKKRRNCGGTHLTKIARFKHQLQS